MLDGRLSSLPAVTSAGGTVLLWHLDLRPRPQDAGTALLSAVDRERTARLPQAHARRLLARRALLAALAADHLGCRPQDLRLGADARSVTARSGRATCVSVSTSGARGLVALAPAPVGIDLELLAPVPEAVLIARSMFSDAERAWVEAAPAAPTASRDERFLRTWVRKEAVVKALGVGLTGMDLRAFTVDARLPTAAVVDGTGASLDLQTVDLPLDGAVAALAVAPPSTRPPCAARADGEAGAVVVPSCG